MVKIKNLQTGEIYNLHGANKSDCTKDSVIINRPITNIFRRNWGGVFELYVNLGNSVQAFLDYRFQVII